MRNSAPEQWPLAVGLLVQRRVQLVREWRDVLDQLPGLFVHGPNMAARATVVVSPGVIAQRRQKPHAIPVARWTRRHSPHGETLEILRIQARDPALMLRTDTSATVFDDEEKRARATTQVHKVAGEGYRSDAGGSASWAGCDRTTTLVAGARHVETSSLSARDVPTQPRRFAPSCGPSGRLHAPKSREGMPLVSLSDWGTVRHRSALAMASGSEFSLRRSRTACCADFVLYGSGTTRGTPESGRSSATARRLG